MSNLKHVTEHDGSRWVGLEVVEEMYAMLEDLAVDYYCKCGHKSCRIERTRKEIDELLAKARGEL